jgi:flavin-dependent dehydrogenase
MDNRYDALIIGAGPAGSSAAILLASAGWSVALVEKHAFPRRKVCGECIAASNLRLLHALGVGAAFERAAGAELRDVAFMRGTDVITTGLPPANDADYPWGRALGRETLDTLLLERARSVGVAVFQPWSVHAIAGEAGAWRCELKSGTRASRPLSACVLIDAHGSWQTLSSHRAAGRPARAGTDLLAFKANFTGARLAEGLLPVLAFTGGYGGMVVADAGVATVACCVRRDRLETLRHADRGASAGEAVQTMLERECAGMRQALATATRSGPWLAAGPLNPGIRVHTDDGMFRIGNAAGEAHPIIGEGISMALQSAWLLSSELLVDQYAGRRARQYIDVSWQRSAQRRYAAKWHRRFAPRIRLASAFAHASMNQHAVSALLTLLRHWPGALRLGAALGGKTHCSISEAVVASLAPTGKPI